jgi:carboxylesterase type B
MVGSATNPGLDGSALALATDSIIAVIQYRLGAVSAFTASNSCHYQLTWFL